jgi:hypothetical protein
MASGQVRLPAVPALLEVYLDLCRSLAASLGITARADSQGELGQLRAQLGQAVEAAFQGSARSWVVIGYEAMLDGFVKFAVQAETPSLASTYDGWVRDPASQPFAPPP